MGLSYPVPKFVGDQGQRDTLLAGIRSWLAGD